MLLCDTPATELRELLVKGDITAVELLDSCIARIDAVNPAVNAVITSCFERAHDEATRADADFKAGKTLLPLHGLPVLVKDLADTAGVRTTYGSRCYENHVPDQDSAAVASLRSAGAIVIGKTNTPEFGAGANTSNAVFGATRNPFNTSATSGGSSGGSAVALACSMSPLATGSDLGGSLRIPASFCSVVGMRPSPGMVPSHAHVCGFSPLWTDGPMARSVADVRMCLHSMVGYSALDPLSRPNSQVPLSRAKATSTVRHLRVGFSTDLGVALVDNSIAALFEERQECIGRLFMSSIEPPLQLGKAAAVFRILRAESLYASFADLAEKQVDKLSANVLDNIAEAKSLGLADSAWAHAEHTRLFREFQRVFKSIDVLVCPATAVTPFAIENNHPTSINGESLGSYYSWYAITWALSLMGCPVVTIPCGLDQQGMPFGIQVVGQRYQDAKTLDIAEVIEQGLAVESKGRCMPDILDWV